LDAETRSLYVHCLRTMWSEGPSVPSPEYKTGHSCRFDWPASNEELSKEFDPVYRQECSV
jgi:hypothetical protein